MSSDNGPHFIAEVVQGVTTFLQIKRDLHVPWRPQSSGKVEQINQTLETGFETLSKDPHEMGRFITNSTSENSSYS